MRYEMRYFKIRMLNVVKKDLSVIIVERRYSNEHFVKEDAQKVPVNRFAMAYLFDHFRSKIGVGTTKRFGHVGVGNALFRKTEICQECMAFVI